MNTLLTAAAVLAAVNPAEVKPGWLALVIVLLMCLATFLLWRSMNHQLKKVHFDEGSAPARTSQPAPDDDADADADASS
jgi:ABC-type nickel/cobalt efflux system permease component RcnA